MFKKLALAGSLALAAAMPQTAQAQYSKSFTTVGTTPTGSYTLEWIVGQSTAATSNFYVELRNTSAAGQFIKAFGVWFPNLSLTSTLQNLTFSSGVTSSEASGTNGSFTSNIASWSANSGGGGFSSIGGYDAAAGMTDNGSSGVFGALSSPGAGQVPWWKTTTGAVRFNFSTTAAFTMNDQNTTGTQFGYRGQGGVASSIACGYTVTGAVVNDNYTCEGGPGTFSTVPEPSTYALMTAGLLGIFGVARRRRNAKV